MPKNEEKIPEVSELAIGLRRTQLGWVVTEFTIVNGKVTERKSTEPDMRAIALESLRRKMSIFWV